jgi:putative ABC transport system ATP-binding protein
VLELRDVRKRYEGPGGATIRAVDGVSLTIDAGQLVALYGPSGSGKSTLLMMAAGIARPDAGTVLFDGRDLTALSRAELTRYRRTQLGFVFQSFRLTPGLTAIDNAALKLLTGAMRRREARRRVAPLLDRLGIGARAEHRVDALSHGERQRVAIARALANEPRLLLADEPTGSLDFATGETVMALMLELNREAGTTLVLVAHDPALAGRCDQQLRIEAGRVSVAEAAPT